MHAHEQLRLCFYLFVFVLFCSSWYSPLKIVLKRLTLSKHWDEVEECSLRLRLIIVKYKHTIANDDFFWRFSEDFLRFSKSCLKVRRSSSNISENFRRFPTKNRWYFDHSGTHLVIFKGLCNHSTFTPENISYFKIADLGVHIVKNPRSQFSLCGPTLSWQITCLFFLR